MRTIIMRLAASAFALAFVFVFIGIFGAQAAITQDAPPIEAFFEPQLQVGGGAIFPLVQFRLIQSSGTDLLTKVGIQLLASSSPAIEQGQIAGLALFRESGTEHGFQNDKDALITGAVVYNPAVDGSIILLQPSVGVSLGSQTSEFYIVASTTATANITNGRAFEIRMPINYASTSANTGVGSPLIPGRKVIMSQGIPIKISEVMLGRSDNSEDEFIEIYNPSNIAYDLPRTGLNLYFMNSAGGAQIKSLVYRRRVIPPFGYFLIGSQTNYNGSVELDASYDTSGTGALSLAANGGISLAGSPLVAQATSTAFDLICFGSQPSANCENLDTIGTPNAPLNLQNGSSMERISRGYPDATSTPASLAQGGSDATRGNSIDRGDNSAEFVTQSTPRPQNSLSAKEYPFAMGQDVTGFLVMGSFPGPNMTNVPSDIPFVGFGFNKPAASSTILSATATTTVTLVAQGGSTNLCSRVSYTDFPSNFEPPAKCVLSASLSPSTTYTFTVSPNVRDLSGNMLDQNPFDAGNQAFTSTFTTGATGFTSTNVTPPHVVGSNPFPGSMNIPTNFSRFSVELSTSALDLSTLTAANITLMAGSNSVTLSNLSFSTSTGKNLITFTASSQLAASTRHTLTIGTGLRSLQGVSLPSAYVTNFTTAAQADTTAPSVIAVLPSSNSALPLNTSDFIFIFDDNIDSSTATSGAVTLSVSGGTNLPGAVFYDPVAKEGHFIPSNVLPADKTIVLTLKGASLRNVSNIALGTDITRSWGTEISNSDSQAPSLLSAQADDFQIAITFNEPVNTSDATNLDNYALTTGGASQTLSSLAGHMLVYDQVVRTARLMGVRLPAGSTFTIAASNIRDRSGNTMTSSSVSGTVNSFRDTGGFVGPGNFEGSSFGDDKSSSFASANVGFVEPVKVQQQSPFVNASTTYFFSIPITRQIPSSGTIVIAFPSSSDFSLCCAALSSTQIPQLAEQNADINGPGTGTVGFSLITTNPVAKTITLTLNAATQANDFLRFGIANIKNPSVPKNFDSSGYMLDIKSRDASNAILESFTPNPIYIGGGATGGMATTSISGTVSGNGGVLVGVTIHLGSPQTGLLDAVSGAGGLYRFENIPVNQAFLQNNFGGGEQYMLFTDPFITNISDANGATSTSFFGQSTPTPLSVNSSAAITRNFTLTSTLSAVNMTVRLTASASTFGAAENIDVFAGGPGEFVVRTVTPGADELSSSVIATIPLPQVNGQWNIGIGPAMPKAGGFISGPPPAPAWTMPRPVIVEISGCPSACVSKIDGVLTSTVSLSARAADKTISGVLQDTSGRVLSGAMVYAYSPAGGIGNHSQSSITGTFSIRVNAGSYNVGANIPGIGQSKEMSVVMSDASGNVFFIDGSSSASTGSSGSNPFILKMAKPNQKITGRVTDGTNAIGNAHVFAFRTDGSGHSDTLTDSSTGNYTLYVDNGTWNVAAHIPGFGQTAEQSVTIASADRTGLDFSPSFTTSFSILSGRIYEDANGNNAFNTGEGIQGAIIRLAGSSGNNEGSSGSDGAYSIRVPSGSGYRIADIFKSGIGKIAPLDDVGNAIGTINLTASTTRDIRVAVRRAVTFIVSDPNGNHLYPNEVVIDLFDRETGFKTHQRISGIATTTLFVADGASTTARIFIPGVPSSNISIVALDPNTTFIQNGVIKVNGQETVRIVINTATAGLSTVSGTAYHTSATSGNELVDVWLQFVDESNGIHAGTVSTSSGKYSIKVANGTYQVKPVKPGYVGIPSTITVTQSTSTQNFVLTTSTLTLSGSVTAGGSPATDAFVRAEKIGGGETVGRTDTTNGTFSLPVTPGTWRVFAVAEGYRGAASSQNPITLNSTSVSGITVALTSTVTLQSRLATSNTFSDSAGGTMQDSTINVKVDIDAGALGSSGDSSYVTARETSNIPDTSSVNIVGGKGKEISAFAGSTQIKTLQSGKTANIELCYTNIELSTDSIDTLAEVTALKVVSYSEDKKDWESLSTAATYKDSSGAVVATPASNLSNVASVCFSAPTTHFSAFALSQPTGVLPPEPPSSITITAGLPGSGSISVSWPTSSGATGYFLYRDTSSAGTFALLGDMGNVTSYTNSTLSAGTYFYKVSAYKSGGSSESAALASGSATLLAVSGGGVMGGGGSIGLPPLQPLTSATTSTSTAQTQTLSKPATTPASEVARASEKARTVSPVFNANLKVGTRGKDVARLQSLLGVESTGYFGPLTRKAVREFQKKHGIEQTGFVGPLTRSKMKEVFGSESVQEVRDTAKTTAPATPTSATMKDTTSIQIQIDALLAQIKALQEQLKAIKSQ